MLTPVVRFDSADTIPIVANTLPARLIDKPALRVPGAAKQLSFILDSMAAINMPIFDLAANMPIFKEQDFISSDALLQSAGFDGKGLASSIRMGINGSEFDKTRIDAMIRVGGQGDLGDHEYGDDSSISYSRSRRFI